MLLKDIDKIRLEANKTLKNKEKFAQFMTPSVIADYMASLFNGNEKGKSLLDCGAGIGSLTIATLTKKPNFEKVDCWEIDPIMVEYLTTTTKGLNAKIYNSNFLQDAVELIKTQGVTYDYIITNPPYKKIGSSSKERELLRSVGIETVNLYSAFIALSILLLKKEGQIVAIIPRSFCNGVYYKSFRELILRNCSIDYIHSFESRNSLFSDDNVLQENIIIKLSKNQQSSKVIISHSNNDDFSKTVKNKVDFSKVVLPNDENKFIRIPKDDSLSSEYPFKENLNELGLSVSTGQVVDFRVKEFLQENLSADSYPLIYPHHFENGCLSHPRKHKKPNAILNNEKIKKWCLPNNGCYVVVNRFSPKESKNRIVANLIEPSKIDNEYIAIENHLNFFHINKSGIDTTLANGLLCYLKSSILDKFLRDFSGHTQINVGDLKNIPYPNKEQLLELGLKYHSRMQPSDIDFLIDEIITRCNIDK
ncbi:Eco57I restriction-modification methylase domain-containing protein [Mannheimia varigena]|uniref:Eco57I restriction-modification methylase domain-containing protein n=1 Tax=Mannheimia varigena TaxID=85404 RepID=UPI001F023264|nr:Eco57I restriction-modification methylase domain-containing protein [Mannheimia varigena]